MTTAPLQKREQQLELYPRPAEPFVPHFEQVEGRWTWKHVVALTGFSLLVHVIFLLLIVAVIIALPRNSPIVLTAQQLLMKDESVQYLQLAPDKQKPLEHPKTDVISDKDRTMSSRAPSIDRKTLERLADNLRRGAPSPAAGNAPTPAAPQMPQPPQQAQQQPAPQSGPPAQPNNQVASLNTPPLPGRARVLPNFGGAASAGSVIQQAVRAASEQRGGGGESGDYGSGPAVANTQSRSDAEILSDTLGVDFAPYLQRMRIQVRRNWEYVMPESVFPPLRKTGTVVIEFSVLKDGTVTGLRVASSSGDVALDRAAYSALSSSNPMPALPTSFRGDYLGIRFTFFYNPPRGDLVYPKPN